MSFENRVSAKQVSHPPRRDFSAAGIPPCPRPLSRLLPRRNALPGARSLRLPPCQPRGGFGALNPCEEREVLGAHQRHLRALRITALSVAHPRKVTRGEYFLGGNTNRHPCNQASLPRDRRFQRITFSRSQFPCRQLQQKLNPFPRVEGHEASFLPGRA